MKDEEPKRLPNYVYDPRTPDRLVEDYSEKTQEQTRKPRQKQTEGAKASPRVPGVWGR